MMTQTLIESMEILQHRRAKYHARPLQSLNIIVIKLSFYVSSFHLTKASQK